MKLKSYEKWINSIPPLAGTIIVLKTQEERCEFCRKYIWPCVTDILTRDWSKVELPPIEEYTWEVITPYNNKTNERRKI